MDSASLLSAFDVCFPEGEGPAEFGLALPSFSDIVFPQDDDAQMSKMAMEIFDFDCDCDWGTELAGDEETEPEQLRHRHSKDRAVMMKKKAQIAPKGSSRSSKWKGVTKHKITSRWEAHLWDATFERRKSSKSGRQRGRQVYLGGWQSELDAARAYDLASLRYFGTRSPLNFPRENYADELKIMQEYTCADWVAEIRRKSSGFSRGRSRFRGVTSHKGKNSKGKWEARIGRVMGNKYLYLGTFPSERAAAEAYYLAALRFRDSKAVTNFDRSNYSEEDIKNAANDAKIV